MTDPAALRLRAYAHHKLDCASRQVRCIDIGEYVPKGLDCTCGLTQVLALLSPGGETETKDDLIEDLKTDCSTLRAEIQFLKGDYAEYRRRHPAPRPAETRWHPIATCDEGVDVIGYFPGFSEEYQRMVVHRLEGDWYQQDADLCPEPLEEHPTLWHPLPAPPTEKGSET